MNREPPADNGSLATAEVAVPSRAASAHNTYGARPPSEWQQRLWSALATSPRMAVVLGLELAVLLAAAGLFIGLHGPPLYTSTTTMVIDDPYKLATAGDDGQLIKLSGLRVKYSSLAATTVMAGPVADQLHLSTKTVLSNVSVTVPLQSLLIDVVATAPTSKQARALSSAMASEITTYVQQEDVTYAIPSSDRFTITSVGPTSPATASGRSRSHAVTLAVGMGVAGFVVGFCVTQLVRRRKSPA